MAEHRVIGINTYGEETPITTADGYTCACGCINPVYRRYHQPWLPALIVAEYDTLGWDIPSRFMIDAVGRCYSGGSWMHETKLDEVLTDLASSGHDNLVESVRRIFHMPDDKPKWMTQAEAHGWRPPEVTHA